MTIHRLILAATVLIGPAAWSHANEPPTEPRRIARPTAEVRAGPSEKFPVTLTLREGDPVRVRGKPVNEDWLEIVPPAGSLSWVEDGAVDVIQGARGGRMLNVLSHDVAFQIGSANVQTPLEVAARAKLNRGTQLRVLGEKVVHEGKTWWPVQPPECDSRFIHRHSIAPAGDQTVSAAKVAGGTTAPASAGKDLWRQAGDAEREGRYQDAYGMYAHGAQVEGRPGGDFELASRCSTRMRELIESGRVRATTVGFDKSNPGVTITPASRSGSSPVGSGTPAAPAPPLPSLGSPQAGTANRTATPAVNSNGVRGYLRRSGFQIQGRTTYALEDRRGDLIMYATAADGLDLEAYVGRAVELVGSVTQPGDLRREHIHVTRFYPLR